MNINTEFTLTGKHKDNNGIYTDSVTIHVNAINIQSGQNGEPTKTRLVLDGNDPSPNIVDLMEILPTEIRFSGSAYVEGEGNISTNESFWSVFSMNMPLSFEIPDPIIMTGDKQEITDEDIDPDMAEKIRNDVTDVLFHGEFGNHLPVGIAVQVHVAKNADSLYTDTIRDSSYKFIIDNIRVPAAPVDANGMTTDEVIRVVDFELTKKNIELLGSPPYYVGYKYQIDSTASTVYFKTDDYISTKGYFRISVNIDPNQD